MIPNEETTHERAAADLASLMDDSAIIRFLASVPIERAGSLIILLRARVGILEAAFARLLDVAGQPTLGWGSAGQAPTVEMALVEFVAARVEELKWFLANANCDAATWAKKSEEQRARAEKAEARVEELEREKEG